jgi:hypothetical protein
LPSASFKEPATAAISRVSTERGYEQVTILQIKPYKIAEHGRNSIAGTFFFDGFFLASGGVLR